MRLILMPGGLGEVVVERLVGLVVARRIEVEDGFFRRARRRDRDGGHQDRGGGETGKTVAIHGRSLTCGGFEGPILAVASSEVNTNANDSYLLWIKPPAAPVRLAASGIAMPGQSAMLE